MKLINYRLCLSFGFMWDYMPFKKKKADTNELLESEINSLINKADNLYKNNKFEDVYNLLNDKKIYTNGQIIWRLCRALFILSQKQPVDERGDVLYEAHNLISAAYLNKPDHPDINKWMAIILDAKAELEGTASKVKHAGAIRNYLNVAYQQNPNDHVTAYLLGHWCYSLSSLSWFQKCYIHYFYGPIPSSSYEEAKKYLLECEEIKSRSLIACSYLLGKVYFKLNQFENAKYYFNLVRGLEEKHIKDGDYKLKAKAFLILISSFN